MTPLNLQEALKEEFRTIFQGTFGVDDEGNDKLHYFGQFLPVRKDLKDDSYYPYVQVVLDDGNENAEEAVQKVVVIFGIKETSKEKTGYIDIANMIQKTRQHLLSKMYVGKSFEVRKNIQWINADDESYPYFIGGMMLEFNIPGTEFVNENM